MAVQSSAPPTAIAAGAHLRVEGITKSYGSVEALRGVDFAVRRGEVMALVGDNGAGKSTLMKIIAGAERADDGAVFLNNEALTIDSPLTAAAKGISIVYQDLALCENLHVAANLFLGHEHVSTSTWTRLLPRSLRPLDELGMEKQAQTVIKKLQVKTLQSLHTKIGGLSGGQRQAIAIARAIDTHSTVILLDEPTAALGVAQTQQVLDLVKRLRDNNHAVVYISHNLKDIFEVCDRLTALRHGKAISVFERNNTTHEEIVRAITGGMDNDND